jgi:PAS domain-containing protein
MSETLEPAADVDARSLASLIHLDQAVLDALPVGVSACDADGLIFRVNRKATELWGRVPKLLDPADRFCGTYRVESLDGEVIPPDQTPMARAVLDEVTFEEIEAVVFNPDGRRWVARVSISPLRDLSGKIIGGVSCFRDVTREHELRRMVEGQQRILDRAATALQIGTWRYTLADNVCVYDENAQRLYGLTEERFLHDDAGVQAKFHPDDQERMWACVAEALDADGDGRYEVESSLSSVSG